MQLSPGGLCERLEPIFRQNFEQLGDLGASLAIWQDGKSVLELHGGFRDVRREQPWTADTLVLVWSATKGIGVSCLLHALQQKGINLSRRVSEFWPEFAQNGKGQISIGTLLSHSAGLCALDEKVDVLDYPAVIAALERQSPLWIPGTAHGYHARTFGYLIDELNRRISGLSISQYWRNYFGDPLGLDFWIGLPNELNRRTATIYAAKAGRAQQPAQFYHDLATPDTLQRKVFTSPHGLHSISSMNKPEIRAQPIVSFGGIGSATALAHFYGLLANDGVIDGHRYFEPETINWMARPLADGVDLVFEIPTAFSAGFMMASRPTTERFFGPAQRAFGHSGAGGSHAFADPENRIGFAFVMNQMEQSVLPTEKVLRLVRVLYS